jgi:hypothetical protein
VYGPLGRFLRAVPSADSSPPLSARPNPAARSHHVPYYNLFPMGVDIQVAPSGNALLAGIYGNWRGLAGGLLGIRVAGTESAMPQPR